MRVQNEENVIDTKRIVHMMQLHNKHLKLLKLKKEMQLHINHLMNGSINKFDINISSQIRNLLKQSQEFRDLRRGYIINLLAHNREFRVLRKGGKLLHQISQIIMQESGTLIDEETREKFQLWQDSIKSFREEIPIIHIYHDAEHDVQCNSKQ